MIHIEETTIHAINELSDSYPYAASMLTFVVIERELKEYILKNRHSDKILRSSRKIDNKTIRDLDLCSEDEFAAKFLRKLPLGDAEEIVGICASERPSTLRNDIMHSRRFTTGEKNLTPEKRKEIYKKDLVKAKKYVVKVFKNYSSVHLIEIKGRLSFSQGPKQ